MSAVEVRPVEFPRDTVKFVTCWWPIFADDPMWVPPLIFDQKQFFHPKKNPYFKVATIQGFMAYRDGRAVGTICATIDQDLERREPGTAMFGFFNFVNDVEVAKALLDAAAEWLAGHGMKRMRGPFNFSGNHEFGLLVDGFDTPPVIANPHNSAYFVDIYEQLGLTPEKDWYAYWVDYGPVPERMKKLNDRLLKRRPDITLRKANLDDFDNEVAILTDIYNSAWEENWGHTRLPEEEFAKLARDYKPFLDPEMLLVVEVDGEPAALTVALPDFNQVIRKMNGRLFPFGWWHFLMGRKKIDQFRIFILGVKSEYQNVPLGLPMYIRLWEYGREQGYRGADASLILEDNHRMRSPLEKMGFRISKTYRTYQHVIVPDEEGA